ncbi:MAG: NFACT family protein [Methanomicrobia archaeon]|nr:NFACT family protein [Methanomicrobia archaeon]
MSSVDVAAVVIELQELVGARLVKAYQHGKDEIRLKLHQKDRGSLDLIIEAGKRIHLTRYKRPTPRLPSSFAMYIRKHLGGGRLAAIQQLDFDRIVALTLERWDKKTTLLAELLPRGNLVLVDEEEQIMLPLRRKSFATREIKVRTKYERPPSRVNPLTVTVEELKALCEQQDKDVVRVLAAELSLGGLYAEELCTLAGIEKTKAAHALTAADLTAVADALQTLFKPLLTRDKTLLRPHIVLEAQEKLDVLPFELRAYSEHEKLCYDSFNEAADEFFTHQLAEAVEEQVKVEQEKGISKHEHVLAEQLAALQKFERKEAESIQKGELIYTQYTELEALLREQPKGRRTITVTLPDSELPLELDMSLSLHQNAGAYYERAKTFRKKREGVERAIDEMKERIAAEKAREAEREEAFVPEKKEVRPMREEWYEKFRWFETSDGFLVIGGRDATTNELVVKKHMASNDVFCHTQAEGAPVVIAKTGGNEISEAGLKEIAQFATSYSSLWKYGFYEGECYCVPGEQVSKTPPSGEYIKKGSFVVRGKRRYFKAPLGLCIGLKKDKLVVVPATAAQEEQLELYVEIAPDGELDKSELAKQIVKIFLEQVKEHREGEEELEQQVTLEKVQRYLPSGKTRIIAVHPKA